MKKLNTYVNEKLNVNKLDVYKPKYFPESNEELRKLVEDRIKKEGRNVDLNDIDTSKITDMTGIFKDLSFNGNISNWNVSNVTNMSRMFYNNKKLISIDLSKWDVSKVENIAFMFKNCSSLSKIQLPKFNNVITTVGMFEDCTSLIRFDISNINFENVEKCQYMFNNCKQLIAVEKIEDIDVSKAISNNKYEYMFADCPKLHIDISSWGVKKSNIDYGSKFVIT